MLVRKDDRGVLAIGQQAHAWVSGQLARAWGNERFGAVEPYEQVCLAAEQHDVGMAAWDIVPPLNPETGWPQSFLEMALPAHMLLWRLGPRRLVTQSRYAALLISMHGARLYSRRDLSNMSDEEADSVRAFLAEQREFQNELLASLRADPQAAQDAEPELVARNSTLVWIWDQLSLGLCLDWAPQDLDDVPAAHGTEQLRTKSLDRSVVELDPWPFDVPALRISFEGRRLERPLASEEELQAALANGPWETIRLELRKA